MMNGSSADGFALFLRAFATAARVVRTCTAPTRIPGTGACFPELAPPLLALLPELAFSEFPRRPAAALLGPEPAGGLLGVGVPLLLLGSRYRSRYRRLKAHAIADSAPVERLGRFVSIVRLLFPA